MQENFENYFGEILQYICQSTEEGNNDLILYSLQILKHAFKNEDPSKASKIAKQQST